MSATIDSVAKTIRGQVRFAWDGDLDPSLGREVWTVIESSLSGILDGFYERLRRNGVEAYFPRMDYDRLIKLQLLHWQRLFSMSFSNEYVESVRRVGMTHYRIGLTPEWYVAGYAFILNRMIDVIAEHHRNDPARAFELARVVNTLVGIDMGVALSVYQMEGL